MIGIDEALKEFGTYTFEDKGSEEVMDIHLYVTSICDMDSKEVAKTLSDVLDYYKIVSKVGKFIMKILMGLGLNENLIVIIM